MKIHGHTLNAHYSKLFMSTYDEHYYNTNEQDHDRLALGWYSKVLSRHVSSKSDVLDYGCGTGYFVRRLTKFFTVSGYDLSETARVKTKQLVPQAKLFDSVDLIPDSSFDAITSLHVLEHIADPGLTLTIFHRILKNGGICLIVVPALDGRGHRKKGDDWFAFKDPTHCTFLTSSQWRQLCEDSGFEVLIEGSDGLWDSPYLSFLPRIVDRLIFGMPLIFNVLLSRITLKANKGECAVLIVRKSAAQ